MLHILLCFLIITIIISSKKTIKSLKDGGGSYLYQAGPTRCFDCEKDLARRYGTHMAFMGKPTKCFDCEQQMVRAGNPNLANLTQPTKCFDCETQFLT